MEIIALAGGSKEENKIVVWDISSGNIIVTLREDTHTSSFSCVRFSPCGTLLVSGSDNGSLILWDCQTWTKLQTLIGHTESISSIGFDRTSHKIVSFAFDNTVRVWSVVTGVQELDIYASKFSTSSACFIGSGDTIAIGTKHVLKLCDALTGNARRTVGDSKHFISLFQFSQDGDMLVSGSRDTVVLLWDVASGSILRELRGHTDGVSQVCLNADASRVVSCSWDGTARIWDVSTGECLLTLRGHGYSLETCCFSEDGCKVITASDEDGSVKVWDSYTGEELRTLNGPVDRMTLISYRPTVVGSYI